MTLFIHFNYFIEESEQFNKEIRAYLSIVIWYMILLEKYMKLNSDKLFVKVKNDKVIFSI